MPSSGMLRRVASARTDVSDKLSASIIRVTRIGSCKSHTALHPRRRHSLDKSHFEPVQTLLLVVVLLLLRCIKVTYFRNGV
jgi:hypothetical protein